MISHLIDFGVGRLRMGGVRMISGENTVMVLANSVTSVALCKSGRVDCSASWLEGDMNFGEGVLTMQEMLSREYKKVEQDISSSKVHDAVCNEGLHIRIRVLL